MLSSVCGLPARGGARREGRATGVGVLQAGLHGAVVALQELPPDAGGALDDAAGCWRCRWRRSARCRSRRWSRAGCRSRSCPLAAGGVGLAVQDLLGADQAVEVDLLRWRARAGRPAPAPRAAAAGEPSRAMVASFELARAVAADALAGEAGQRGTRPAWGSAGGGMPAPPPPASTVLLEPEPTTLDAVVQEAGDAEHLVVAERPVGGRLGDDVRARTRSSRWRCCSACAPLPLRPALVVLTVSAGAERGRSLAVGALGALDRHAEVELVVVEALDDAQADVAGPDEAGHVLRVDDGGQVLGARRSSPCLVIVARLQVWPPRTKKSSSVRLYWAYSWRVRSV